jgi:hypothetical protein
MAIKTRLSDEDQKTERLRALRLADEAARREAGTWGEVTVGELVHEGSQTVFVHTWKGPRRPDLFREGGARPPGISPQDWLAMSAWVTRLKSVGFRQTILARNLSPAEARKLVQARIAEHRMAGYTVINPEDAP